jgi:DNA-binding NarL/FixJ family response regulator
MQGDRPAGDLLLLVDDSRDELGLLVDAAELAGFTALAATAGDAALALLDRITPHLVVMDAVMPGLDGFETCRRIKRDPRFSHLPVIFMTGLKDPEDVLKGLEAGGVDYVTKPVNLDELMARVRIHIANARVSFGARRALDAVGRNLLATDAGGHARWCTPQAASLLATAIPGIAGTDLKLSNASSGQLKNLITAGEGERAERLAGAGGSEISVSYLGRTGIDEFLFRLARGLPRSEEDQLRSSLALTSREGEVLLWIARGKSNREISEILSISPRTVNKHLERVFAKLGVENRASAASIALRALAAFL